MAQRSGYWNVWWTLAVISAAIGLAAVVLESFGNLRDFGVVIAFASVALVVLVGLAASTRAAARPVEFSVDGIVTRVDHLRAELHGLRRALEDIRGILRDRLPPR